MCLAIPARIVELSGAGATVDIGGNRRDADISLLDEVRIGDYVLLHAGFAITRMEEDDALETLKIWEKVSAAANMRPTDLPEE